MVQQRELLVPTLRVYGTIFAVAVPLNYAWEMAQAPLYESMGTFSSAALRCFVASLGDGLLTLLTVASVVCGCAGCRRLTGASVDRLGSDSHGRLTAASCHAFHLERDLRGLALCVRLLRLRSPGRSRDGYRESHHANQCPPCSHSVPSCEHYTNQFT